MPMAIKKIKIAF